MPKLIFYDIDGTLIDQRTHRVPESALAAMKKAHDRGCLNIINTGRTLCNLDRRLEGTPIDGWVLGCGTRVILRGETLLSFTWSREESRKIRETILETGMAVVYEGDDAIWLEKKYPKGCPQIEGMAAYAEREGIGRYIDPENPDFTFVKLFTFTEERPRVDRLLQALEGRFEAIERKDTGTGWEIVPTGCSKGSGIDVIRGKLGTPLTDCYVIGDSQNDLSMLTHVPNSIAMGNAEPAVREICAYVTAPVEQDGIARALRHFHLSEP